MLQGFYAGVFCDGAIVLDQLLIQTAVAGFFKFLDGFFVDHLQRFCLDSVDELLTVFGGVVGFQDTLCFVCCVDCVFDYFKYTVHFFIHNQLAFV